MTSWHLLQWIAYVLVLLIAAVWIASLAWGLRRLGVTALGDPRRPARGTARGERVAA